MSFPRGHKLPNNIKFPLREAFLFLAVWEQQYDNSEQEGGQWVERGGKRA